MFGLQVWCILASVLLASTQAIRYDLNPQKFYGNNQATTLRSLKSGGKEVVLYLTPSQVKALEASGAVVRPQVGEPETTTEAQNEEPAVEEPQQEADQEQAEEQTENENDEEEIRPVSDLEEIFRILNEQIEEQQRTTETATEEQAEEEQTNEEQENDEDEDSENESDEESEEESEEESNSESEEETEAENESDSEEEEEDEKEEKKEVTEKPRDVPARFRFVAKSQKAKKQDKYVAPIVAKKEKQQAKNYAYIRFLPNAKTEEITLQLVNTNEQDIPTEEASKQEEQVNTSTGAPPQQQPANIVPYEVTELPEEAAPAEELEVEEIEGRLAALLTPLINHEKIAESINEQKKKLLQNELEIQTLLRELTQAPKHNDQKYAIEIERLRANLEKQNALAKAEALARSATTAAPIVKEEAKKKRRLVQSAKSGKKKTAPTTALAKLTQLSETKKAQTETVKPVQKADKQKVEKSAQLQAQKRVPATVTKYVKVPNKYPVQRVIPVEIKREIPATLPIRKSEKSRVIRPVWEH